MQFPTCKTVMKPLAYDDTITDQEQKTCSPPNIIELNIAQIG